MKYYVLKNDNQKEQLSKLGKRGVRYLFSYLEWVNTLLEDEKEKLQRIRYVPKRSCPFEKKSWVNKMATRLNLVSTLNPIGRPKKGT